MRWWPRSIRWQMILGVVVLEALSIAWFALLLIKVERHDGLERARQRLEHQSSSMALQAQEAYTRQRPEWAGISVKMMGSSPSVARAKITDPAGNVLYENGDSHPALDSQERAEIALIQDRQPHVFSFRANRLEGVTAIYAENVLRGFAWVESDRNWDYEQLKTFVRATLIFGCIWVLASALLVYIMSRSISRPMAILHRGTHALMNAPDSEGHFPLPVTVDNEFGELIEAFNRMVASLDEQRTGLNDTLSLLDSMLANAPVGLAFFDRRSRIVRVNRVFANLTGTSLSGHLGRTLPDLLPQETAEHFERALSKVFTDETAVHDQELHGPSGGRNGAATWLLSAYPVHNTANQVRWAGVVVQDVSERKRNEESLRKTEKLAATGRLAASIAHEINNPLEAITNLLFLLRNFCGLDAQALNYVEMAEYEARRIAEIAQQTLRFYRQSTLPARATMAELLDSVLNLYANRLGSANINLVRDFDLALDVFCYAGEIRQVVANLVGNALDATSAGGTLTVRARNSRNWRFPDVSGVRITVADTGDGIEESVKERIFEAFFTTKVATGTGLGLWVSHEIILKHGGTVRVRSRVENGHSKSGTVFQLFLPDNHDLVKSVPATLN